MPKRTGLGQRGLDLLIPTDSTAKSVEGKINKGSTGKRSTKTDNAVTKGARTSGKKETKASGNDSTADPDGIGKAGISAAEGTGSPVMVPLSRVEPNREQPRKNFDEDALQELAESIRQYGIIQPLIVQEKDGYYEIIAGERRWRAARIAALKEIPVIIREYTPREVMEISLIENIQREDLNPIEEAAAYRRLMEEYHLKQDEVAERVSKSRAAVANSVRLLNLDERVQDMVISEMISTGHARALLAFTDPEQQFQAAQKVFDEKLTVRDVERLVRKMNETPPPPAKRKISDAVLASYTDLAEKMKTSLGTKVYISPKNEQKGKIEIEYYSSDELDRLCSLLNGLTQGEGV